MKGILFLCVANSARSQLAEGIARRLAPAGVGVFSAGSQPGTIHPLAIAALREIGIDASSQYSKPIDAVPRYAYDTVVTLCAEEVCPLLPGSYIRLHWPLPDPAGAGADESARLEAFRAVRDELLGRLQGFFGGSVEPEPMSKNSR